MGTAGGHAPPLLTDLAGWVLQGALAVPSSLPGATKCGPELRLEVS